MPRDVIEVVGLNDADDIICDSCNEHVAGRRIAMLLRRGPDKPFGPVCLDCALLVVTGAIRGMADSEIAIIL